MSKSIVLIPSYEPEEVLVNLCSGLKNEGFLVIVINDGSGEKFNDIFSRAGEYAHVYSYEKNRGKGDALKYGYSKILEEYPDYDYVLTVDGDGQHRIKDIVKMNEVISKYNVPIIGERKFDVKTPLKSRMGNSLSKFTQALATYRYLPDNQCGLRAFLVSSLKDMIKIKGSRYEYEMNVLTYLQLKELPFRMMTIQTIYENNNACSHFRPVQDTLRIQGSLFLDGLIALILFILQGVGCYLLAKYPFKDITVNLELAAMTSFAIALVLHLAIKIIMNRPKYPAMLILRVVLYQCLILIATVVSVTLFSRVLSLPIGVAYLFTYLLAIIPLFYIIKGVGIVYDSQINEGNDL